MLVLRCDHVASSALSAGGSPPVDCVSILKGKWRERSSSVGHCRLKTYITHVIPSIVPISEAADFALFVFVCYICSSRVSAAVYDIIIVLKIYND